MRLIEYYKARFQIEFAFRDAKQHTGLRDCQSTCKKKLYNHFNTSLTALNLLKLEDRQEKGIDDHTVISIDSWKRRKANLLFMEIIFSNLEIDVTSRKIKKLVKDMKFFGSIAA
jgi:Transposase DDE domain